MQTTQRLPLALAALTVLAIGPSNIFATALNTSGGGIVNVTDMGGTSPVTNVAVTSVPTPCISFAGKSTCSATAATTIHISASDPIFLAGNTGTIKDIGTTFPIVGFKTAALAAGGTAVFDLTSIQIPTGPACTTSTNSGSCSTGYFTLTQVGPSVSIQFATTEIAYIGNTSSGYTPYQGIFTTQAVNTTIGAIVSNQLAGGTISSTWSATESPTGPGVHPFSGCTVTQGGWHAPAHGNNPGTFLNANFGPTYGPSGVTIGGLNFLTFTSPDAIRGFLPQGGTPSFLNSSAINPTTRTSAGVFAGQVLALELNVDLEGLGSLTLKNTGTPFDNQMVSAVLQAANIALGGGPLPPGFASYSALNDLIDSLNSSFDGCSASTFGTNNLH